MQPAQNPEPYLPLLQEYQAKNLPRSRDYLESEEDSLAPGKPTVPQLTKQDPRVHSSSREVFMSSNSLLREILKKPPIAQSSLTKVQRNLLDSAVTARMKPTVVDLTSDTEDSQREQLNYWPTVIDAAQEQQYVGHSCTGVSYPEMQAYSYYDNPDKIANRDEDDSDSTGHQVSKRKIPTEI
ncbi:unnamed protein product [Gongylonema pulchrum]|uniref:ZM domain-containing protein n=1 Tax=Gongylonema pulchrum TaxID=637853 RepID=A0A183DF34_9BILA|nr:unnamed protein product [Gongylonema pulchrum]